MTPTEKAKRSDALYYETVSVNRRVLCDMIANREADLEDARESVKRLMTQRDERLARAETDNAKLRELVTYALKHIIEFECEEPDREKLRGKPCEDCADYGSSDCPKCMPRMFDVSGIEVDDG